MQLEESRRLTGPNLFSELPGAICDIEIAAERHEELIAAWRKHAHILLEDVGWTDSACYQRSHASGLSLVITAPLDCLYAATDVNEAAFEMARSELMGVALPSKADTLTRLRELIVEECNPSLLELSRQARSRRTPFLVDDDEVSLGYGRRAHVWDSKSPPESGAMDWDRAGHYGDVPVALVTGTNGKSTTVRLAASIVAASGRTAGVTSTDYIRVGETVIDTGDYSGPGGARALLRHPDTEVALLEVARGGILRRGLGVTDADTALITNVAADHLGEYGIHTVDELRSAKFVVQKGLANKKPLILNADDAGVVTYAQSLGDQIVIWFSESSANAVVKRHTAAGGTAVVVDGENIALIAANTRRAIVRTAEVPITLGGSARHNVQNALAAAALCHALGCDDTAIRQGLLDFAGGPDENPGRGNFFEGDGVKAVVDFAHNEHGLRAMADTLANMPARRRLILMGQAGDRSDVLIEGLTRAALSALPDQLVICQLPGYERGRAPTAVPQLIEKIALDAGLDPKAIHHAESPSQGTRFALDWATSGDLLLILALTERDACIDLLRQRFG